VQELRDGKIEELLEEVFSLRSVPRCYKQDNSRVYELVGGQSSTSKGMNMEAKEATALEAVTRRQPMKIQQTEKI
jgi:hypothetical protein